MQILGTAQRATPRPQLDSRSATDGWSVLAWVGAGFLVMGLVDIALGWYPASFGDPEWEFGAISAALNGFALPTLALYLMLATALARKQTTFARVLGAVFVLLVLVLVGLGVIYATVVPAALKSVAENALLTTGMRKAIIKATMLFLTYIVLFSAAAVRSWRFSARTSAH